MWEYLLKLGAYIKQETARVHFNLGPGNITYLAVTTLPETLEIYKHVLEEYGLLSAKELLNKDSKMKTDITTETNFEDLVKKIEDGAKNAVSQPPYTDVQTIAIGLALISRSGYYTDDCCDWNRKNKTD